MIEFIKEDILKIEAEAIVNSVNLKGVMGKGLALAMKNAYPQNYKLYKEACEKEVIKIGKIFVTEPGEFFPKYIVNFPTKNHWRFPSKYEYIEAGLVDLKNWIKENDIKSVAIPPLGSGNGKLNWVKVKEIILDSLRDIRDSVKIIIVEPSAAFESFDVKKPSSKSHLTPARAMLIYLMRKYQIMGYEINFLVAQKLAYFLQHFGEELKLKYEKGYYGPYAYNLMPVLNLLNNNYIKFSKNNDNKPATTIRLITDKVNQVEEFINTNLTNEQKERLNKALEFIKGFETPFGLELLGTLDFIFREKDKTLSTDEIIPELKNWTDRKEKLFKPQYISAAKKRLLEYFCY
jgi:O-acetyl-ADP-ribose deacetylase (regulator of RNase III)/uncharacterized protein YwgA